MSEYSDKEEIMAYTSEIVSSYVSNNQIDPGDISAVIIDVYSTLSALGGGVNGDLSKPVPAVAVEDSVQPDYLICLEDGKKLKMLKRHLRTAYDMSPEEYRERWSLPADYPMVAPSYAEKRSKLAKDIGLGKR